ncbi:CHAT domain-containing protein [Streptomyces sp. QL37]|uniref:CHAT domain-containing protein n=1 Tax=Streptomyces sp. QL37 TaxID=2093747 RepID=UPI000CF2A9C7|nr:CHAT domain-containing protein [Streptomyces sp. QL37]PPQ60180.1 hypothetical protein C5F59_28520 [Streptomyces sp. QL37]
MKHNQQARRASWLLRRAHRWGRARTLRKAAEAFELVIAVMPADHPDRPACLGNLGVALWLRYERTGDPGFVDRLIEVNELLVTGVPRDHPDRVRFRSNLHTVLGSLVAAVEESGSRRELARLLPLARESAEGPVYRPVFLPLLVECLAERYKLTSGPETLTELVALERELVSLTDDGAPEAGAQLAGLGADLRTLALLRGEPETLREAVAVGRRAAALCPTGHEDRSRCLSSLGNSLHALFSYEDRSPATLREAVAVSREAVAVAPAGHPHRSASLTGLGISLRTHFEEYRDLAVLREAVQVSREAVDAAVQDVSEYATHLANLSAAAQELFKRTGDTQAITEALEAARRAVALSPEGSPHRAGRLSELGNVLHILSQGHAGATAATRDAAPVGEVGEASRESVRVAREAVAAGGSDNERGGRLSNLGVAARSLFEVTGEAEALDEAVRAARDGLAASPPGTRMRELCLLAVVRALGLRPPGPAELEEMRRCCAELAAMGAVPRTDVIAHLVLARATMAAGGSEAGAALAAYESAIARLPEIASRHLLRPDREYGLGELAGLPAEAASAALDAGQPERAILLLEHARGLLMRESTGSRRDLDAVRRADPVAADEFVRLHELLNAADRSSSDLYRHGTTSSPGDSGWIGQRKELAERWDDLLARIRRLPLLEGFLMPPAMTDLRRPARRGPIVMINASSFRCDALLLGAAEPVRVLRLDCDYAELRERALSFQWLPPGAQDARTGSRPRDEQRTLDDLAWLWDHITEPVLGALGLLRDEPGPAAPPPRLWWCPVGVAAFLPLHAAGRPAAQGQPPTSVLDHVVSSYTSTITALQPAGQPRPSPPDGDEGFLVVELSRTPGARALPGARAEARRLAELLPRPTVLSGERATRDAVLAALPRHRVAHFACHALTHPVFPALSRLLLHDHASAPLTVTELTALRVPHGELAYLSACETAKSTEALVDEAVHIAAALQLAGYRHVIATLWPIADGAAGRVADDFYTGHAPSFDLDDTARMLHRAVRGLRADAPHRPSLWAAHIHLGE